MRLPQDGQNGIPGTTLPSQEGHFVIDAEGLGPVEDESDELLKNPINDLCSAGACSWSRTQELRPLGARVVPQPRDPGDASWSYLVRNRGGEPIYMARKSGSTSGN